MLSDEEIVRLYGPWRHRTPADAVELFNGYPGRWWIAGGWAIEVFTGIHRPHGDLGVSIPRSDVALLRQHLNPCLDVWAADKGTLRPLIAEVDEPVPSTCRSCRTMGRGERSILAAGDLQMDVCLRVRRASTQV